jgi:DNA-binding winged helix-turn-helix (wHTH) protein
MSNEFTNLYEFSSFRFDTKTNTLWREGEIVPLSPKALELLKLLLEKHGKLVPKQEIFDTVWADTFVEEGVLTQNIYTLRQALGTSKDGKPIIENHARRGYRLTVPVNFGGNSQTFVEEERSRRKDDKIATKPFLKLIFIPILILLLLLISFLSFRFLNSKTSEISKNSNAELKFKQLTDTGDASYLTISADGNLVAYTRGADLFLRNLQNNNETKLNIENAKKVGCLQFSPDSNFIYFGNINNRDEIGGIFRVSQTGGVPEPIAENIWSGFSLSPDGKELAFIRKSPDENKESLIIK